MKRLFKILGAVLLLILVCVVAIGGYAKYQSDNFATNAIPYIKVIMPEIVTWDKEKWRKHMAPEAKSTLDQPDSDVVFKAFQKLGKFVGSQEPTEINFFAGADGTGISAKATYMVKAKFENGDADLVFSLIGRGSAIQLLGLNVNSPALLK